MGLAIDLKESLVKRNTLQYFIFYFKDTFKKPQYLVPQESLLRHLWKVKHWYFYTIPVL